MALWKPSDLIRFTLCPQRINRYTCHLHKGHVIFRESATQRTEVDPVAERQHTSFVPLSTHRVQALPSWSIKPDCSSCGHLSSLGAVEAVLPTHMTLCYPSFLLLLAQCVCSLNAHQTKSSVVVKTSLWEGAMALLASTAGPGGRYSPTAADAWSSCWFSMLRGTPGKWLICWAMCTWQLTQHNWCHWNLYFPN